MANRIVSSNPHGKLDVLELAEFEKQLRTVLPPEYRNYLIEHNGGKFENRIVSLPGEGGETRIHHIYGLHHGPAYARLADTYIWFAETFSADYLPVSDDSFGNWFCLKLRGPGTGAIYFGYHEKMADPEDIEQLVYLAGSFDEFLSRMKSEEQSDQDFRTRDPEGYARFQKRLEEAREARRRWVEGGD